MLFSFGIFFPSVSLIFGSLFFVDVLVMRRKKWQYYNKTNFLVAKTDFLQYFCFHCNSNSEQIFHVLNPSGFFYQMQAAKKITIFEWHSQRSMLTTSKWPYRLKYFLKFSAIRLSINHLGNWFSGTMKSTLKLKTRPQMASTTKNSATVDGLYFDSDT